MDFDHEAWKNLVDPPARLEIKPPRGRGRQTTYSLDKAIEICDRIGDGEILISICNDPDMPSKSTVFRWIAEFPEFKFAYQCAMNARFDGWAETLCQIADEGTSETTVTKTDDETTNTHTTHTHTGPDTKSRLRIRQWIMAKRMPHTYGEFEPINLNPTPEGELEIPDMRDITPIKREESLLLQAIDARDEKLKKGLT